jgi:hypothetical protein
MWLEIIYVMKHAKIKFNFTLKHLAHVLLLIPSPFFLAETATQGDDFELCLRFCFRVCFM